MSLRLDGRVIRRPLRAAAVVAIAVLGSFGLPPAGGGAHSWTLLYNNAYPVPRPDPICDIDPTAARTTQSGASGLDLDICD